VLIPFLILTSLAVFWGVSLLNVFKHKGNRNQGEPDENPLSPAFSLALIGTLLLFAEALVFSYLSFRGIQYTVLGIFYTPSIIIQLIGAAVFSFGCLLHAWSVHVRGKHAVSWVMPKDHQIISAAPYSIVRHPSYLGYMLMILGLTITWGNWVTLISWIAIPGYYYVSLYEEQMLIQHFGDKYREYMKKVNGFIPRI
jgi:protein-S-isoprenylcysteine O-methyltransferase Ste14